MPDEDRLFDVARPGQSSPQATSKPVIVGHHPTMSDPMVRDASPAPATRIAVQDTSEETKWPTAETAADKPAQPEVPNAVFDHPSDLFPPTDTAQTPPQSESPAVEPVFPTEPDAPDPVRTIAPEDKPDFQPPTHVDALRVVPPKRRRGPLFYLGILIILLAILAGLAFAGVFGDSLKSKLPFSKKAAPAAAPAPAASQTTAPTIPAGYTEYKIAGTTLTFSAPTAWGIPTSSTDGGFSARGANKKSDGTYAYLVDFATNKDVQIAVTSAKYLPPARSTLYYDFLQWCTGTADGKYYFGVLRFSTSTDKIDTPSTITCDQGPLTDVTKIDDSSIVQLKAKAADGSVLGDLYTKNLEDKDLPVLRVKDAKSASGDDIKKLLTTVKFSAQ